MNEPTTSPAPWYSRRHANGVSVYDSTNHTVAHYICNPADAKLMLAAPSLVSAVQAAICLLETLPASLHDAETFRVLENLRIAYTLAEYSPASLHDEAGV